MENDDSSWVFDSLVCFLNGPLWNAPLQSFIEEKSLIFEPSVRDNPEYKIIYEEFKNLVDLMLGTYMEDIGITSEQFETACSKQYTSELPLQFHKNLFEQIWAANDYNVFIRMMCQRNIELQLQALEMIKSKTGLTPPLLSNDEESSSSHVEDGDIGSAEQRVDEVEDAFIMNEIKKQIASEKRLQEQQQATGIEEEIKKISTEFENQLQDELIIKKQELDKALENAITEKTAQYESLDIDNPPESLEPIESPDNPEPDVDDIKFSKLKIDEDDLKKRQEYLKAQRDKLVALKKQVREKQLKTTIDSTETASNEFKRPKSAKIAKEVLAGNKKVDSQSLHVRRALAERLRAEVISQKE